MEESLLVERGGDGVCVLTLNRPTSLNAIDMALAARLAATFDAFARDDGARCIVLTGAGRAFCAGFDIAELATFDPDAMMAAFIARDPLFLQVATMAKPVIAALNGVAYGAGALLAAASDMRVGCPATVFKVTAANYGAANATWSLPRIVGAARAKELLMTGRPVGGEEAVAIGLLNRIADDALAEALEIARAIAGNPPAGVAGVKRLVDANAGRSLEDAYRAEFAWVADSIRGSRKGGAEVFTGFLGRDRSPER